MHWTCVHQADFAGATYSLGLGAEIMVFHSCVLLMSLMMAHHESYSRIFQIEMINTKGKLVHYKQ